MCLTCGCLRPNDRHGDSANFTRGDLKRAAKTAVGPGTPAKAAANIKKTLRKKRY